MPSSLLGQIVSTEDLGSSDGRSGAALKRATLRDGSSVVLKYVTLASDWIARATRDTGRLPVLWEQGLFDSLPPDLDTAMLAVERTSDGWVVVMRDVSHVLLPDDRVLTREENRRLLATVHRMHEALRGLAPPGLCDLRDRFRAFSRARVEADLQTENGFAIAPYIVRGWELFESLAPRDVADAIFAIHKRQDGIAVALEQRPSTIIHGDLRLANVGLADERVILLDWGSSCAIAPSALEFAWYLIISASRIAASREEVIADFTAIEGERFDHKALQVSLIGVLAMLGWNKAFDIVDNPDAAVRKREQTDLEWWCAKVRSALDVWSPV